MKLLHIFYIITIYFFVVPPSKIFVHMNPLQVHFDLNSILWLNSFSLNLHGSLLRTKIGSPHLSNNSSSISSSKRLSLDAAAQTNSSAEPRLMYMDVKLEAIMPRIVIESSVETPNQKDRPKVMQIQISRFALTNIRETGSSRTDLAQALHSLQEGTLVFGSGFPSDKNDMCVVTDRILSHIAANDVLNFKEPQQELMNVITISPSGHKLHRYSMWSEPRDVWCIKLDPIWIDFLGARSLSPNKSIPFIDAVPITLWVHAGNNKETDSGNENSNNDSKANMSGKSNTNVENIESLSTRNPFANEEYLSAKANTDSSSNNSCIVNERTANIHAIAHVSNLISVQIDHYQYLFLLRLTEEITEMTTFLSLDAERILQKVNLSLFCPVCLI